MGAQGSALISGPSDFDARAYRYQMLLGGIHWTDAFPSDDLPAIISLRGLSSARRRAWSIISASQAGPQKLPIWMVRQWSLGSEARAAVAP